MAEAKAKTLKVTMKIDTEDPTELAKILENHIEWVMDLEGNSGLIDAVYDVKAEEIEKDPDPDSPDKKGGADHNERPE